MPSFNITIPETIESVSRPIIYSVLETIKKYLLIKDDVRVIFPGDIGAWTQTTGGLKDKTKESQFSSERYFEIDVEQNPVESNLNSTAVYYAQNPPIILDKDIELQVTPIYSRTDVIMTLKFVTYNKDEAFRWYYNARTEIAKMQDIYINTVVYHYPLPDPLMSLIETIYKLKENVAGDGLSFQQYVEGHFTNRATTISSLDAKDKRVAIRERQTRILGRFEFNPLPEKPELIDDNQAWVCSFQYKFSYDLPMSLNMRYPLMVHNQLLPEPFLNYDMDPYQWEDIEAAFPASLKAMRIFEPYRMSNQIKSIPFRLPKIDDFVPEYSLKGTSAIFYALIQLDPNNLQYICHLDDLDYIQLDKHILDFISQNEYQYITIPYESIFNISLYVYGTPHDPSILICKPDLSIWSSVPLDLKKNYHIRFSVYTNYNDISSDAIYRLYNFIPQPKLPNYQLPFGNNFPSDASVSLDQISTTVNVRDIVNQPVTTTTSTTSAQTYEYQNTPLNINLNVIENYVNSIFTNKPVVNPVPYSTQAINPNQNYTPSYGNLNTQQKFLLLTNPFYNPNPTLLNVPTGGSDVFKIVNKLIKADPLEVNYIYRTRNSKNLFNTVDTTNNNLNNMRSQTDKTYSLMSSPLITSNNTENYIGYKTVVQSGVVVVPSKINEIRN